MIRSTNSPIDSDPKPLGSEARVYLIAGGAALVLLGLLFGAWALFAELEGAVLAPGKIAVEGRRKTVQAAGNGVVSALLIEEGDEVEKGELLLRIDHTVSRAASEAARSRLDSLLAREDRLEAEEGDRSTIRFSKELLDREEEPAVARLLAEERSFFRARSETRAAERRVLGARIPRLEATRQGHLARATAAGRELAAAEEELAGAQSLFEAGYLSRTRVRTLERIHAAAEGELALNAAEAERTAREMEEVRLQQERNRKLHFQEVVGDLETTRADLVLAREALIGTAQRLRHASIHAPATGRVFGLAVHTVGGVVREGEELLQIVPTGAPLIVEVRVPVHEVDRISPGQLAQVQLSGFDQTRVPPMEGVVDSVSADRFEDDARGTAFYGAQIRIDAKELEARLDLELRAGMPADTWISTGSKSALSYLIEPLTDSWSRSLLDG